MQAGIPGIKALFNASALSNDDFLYLIADAVGEGIQYGYRDEVCVQMMHAYRNNMYVECPAYFGFRLAVRIACALGLTCIKQEPDGAACELHDQFLLRRHGKQRS